MNRSAPKGLIISTLIIGIILFLGVSIYKINNNYRHKEYIETKAMFVGPYDYYTNDNGENMYHLKYEYVVNGKSYYYRTDYGTSVIPKYESEIVIKYNPNDPSQVYSKSFDVFSVFQIVGFFFIFISLVTLFSKWHWFRNIIMIIGTGSLIITFITNGFYTGGFIIALIILGIMCFASIMEFIIEFKNKKIHPLSDIKKDILISKKLRLEKKERKKKLTIEEKTIKEKKKKRIIKGITLFIIPIPIYIIIITKFPSINYIVDIIMGLTASICTFVGFCIVGSTLVGFDDNTTVVIAGKVIDNEDIKNRKNMTLIEKIKTFNIIGIILRILGVPAGLGLFMLLINGLTKLFNVFSIPIGFLIIAIIVLVIVLNALFKFFRKKNFSKSSIIITLIIECILTWYCFYYILYLA